MLCRQVFKYSRNIINADILYSYNNCGKILKVNVCRLKKMRNIMKKSIDSNLFWEKCKELNIEESMRAQLLEKVRESFANGSPLLIDPYGMTEKQVWLVKQIYNEIIVKERLETHVHLRTIDYSKEPTQDELSAKNSTDRLTSRVKNRYDNNFNKQKRMN